MGNLILSTFMTLMRECTGRPRFLASLNERLICALTQAISLDSAVALMLEATPEQALLPLTAGLDDIPVLAVTPREAELLRQGQRIAGPRVKPGQYFVTDGSVPVALVEVIAGDMRVVRGFNLSDVAE